MTPRRAASRPRRERPRAVWADGSCYMQMPRASYPADMPLALCPCTVALFQASTSASVPVLVLIPAAGFNSQGCAGFYSGLLELKPAQPQGESPAFPGRVPASPHGRRRYPGLPTASAVGIAESETLPRASRGASLMRLLWSAAGPAPRCHGAVPVSQLETAPWTAENGPRGSRVPKPQASGSRGQPRISMQKDGSRR